jgi:hypothetical protein
LVFAFALLALSAFARLARAETLEAPIGGATISLGEGRIACSRSAAAWVVEASGRSVRPPATTDAVGTAAELRVARSAAECAKSTSTVKLVATAPWPNVDPSSFTLAIDEGRLKGRGRALVGTLVSWPTDQGLAADACRDVTSDRGVDNCVWGVPKTVSADPSASDLRWWPAGAHVSADAVLFNAEGKQRPPDAFAITPSRTEVTNLLPPKASVDVSSGMGRLPLVHPEVVQSVDCRAVRCAVDAGILVVQAPPASVSSIDVQFRLAAHVYDTRTTPPETAPVVRVTVLRCPMSVPSGAPLRGVEGARAVVRLEGACMHDVASLGFLVGTRRVDVAQTVSVEGASYVVLELNDVRAPDVTITAVRGEGEGAVVAMARTETRQPPVVRTTLEIPGFPPVDFIPRNRRAVVYPPHVPGAELVLLSVQDVYEASTEGGVTTVQGDINAVGLVALRFGYRVPKLPAPLDGVDLAVLSDVLQRSVKEANVPAPFGATALSAQALAEVVCAGEQGNSERAVPGVALRIPFASRYGCRLILHRERLSPEYGTQKLTLDVEVNKLDLSARGEAHVTQTLILRSGPEPLVVWLKGVIAPFDRIIVRLSQVADEAHYSGALDIIAGEPAVQWTILFPSGRIRTYATTVIPTGLYRLAVGPSGSSGILAVSLGILSRLTWLDRDGHEGLLGFEVGLLALGLAGETAASGQQLLQVGAVAGLGLSLPIANAGQPTQASISLHVWFEQLVVGISPPPPPAGMAGIAPISDQAFIFGPSISLGNVGTTF